VRGVPHYRIRCLRNSVAALPALARHPRTGETGEGEADVRSPAIPFQARNSKRLCLAHKNSRRKDLQ